VLLARYIHRYHLYTSDGNSWKIQANYNPIGITDKLNSHNLSKIVNYNFDYRKYHVCL